jgi:GNAT superfamily N-acetyltransferase
MQIRSVDPADTAEVTAFHEASREASTHGLENATPRELGEVAAQLRAVPVGERFCAVAGYDGGRVVATGLLGLPLMDNLSTAQVQVTTRPGERRRGHGRRVLEHLVALADEEGRTVLQSEISWNHTDAPDGRGTPGVEFATRHGFELSLVDVKRALSLPVPAERLEALRVRTGGHHRDYVLRDWEGPVPDELVEDFGALMGSLAREAPMGDLVLEDEVFDAARIRAEEEVLVAAGRRKHTTVAVAADGTLAAYTELVVSDHDPAHVFQWGTLVRPAHRGHRLGMAVKLRNLARVQAAEPGRSLVVTWNAEVNAPMVAVNDALGFRPVGRLGEFQRRLQAP